MNIVQATVLHPVGKLFVASLRSRVLYIRGCLLLVVLRVNGSGPINDIPLRMGISVARPGRWTDPSLP